MTWSVTRTGGVIHVDLALAENSEWEAILLAVDAEIAAALTSQVVIHGGRSPAPTFREALQESLAKIVTGLGIKVRTVYEKDPEI